MGTTKIEQPSAPAAPTTAQNMADYVANYPALMALEQQYNPQQAALELQIAQQYGPQYASLYKSVNDSLYPTTAGLQENLAGQAVDAMKNGMPDSMKQQYQDQFRAEIGDNVGSGIGADYVSRNMINQGEQYKNYYQNLALSLAGRQPLGQYASPTYQNAGEGYNYGQVGNNATQGYGSYAGLYGSMYGSNGAMAQENLKGKYGLISSGISAGGAMGAARMCWVASEVFGGWLAPKTCRARYYVINQSPSWFRRLYAKYGERFAKFISNKPILKSMIRPLFEYFAKKAEGEVNG